MYFDEIQYTFSSFFIFNVECEIFEHRPFLYFVTFRHDTSKLFDFW